MLDSTELAVFVRVIEEGSMAAAARVLRVPRSTVTRRIAALEERLHVQLIHRTTRSMSLTPAGEVFYERARRLVTELVAIESEVIEQNDTPTGRLRVTAPVEFGDGFILELCLEYMDAYPDVLVEMDLTNRMVDLVGEGYDVAVRAGRLADSTLVARKLSPVEFRVYASPGYVERFGAPAVPDELLERRVVMTTRFDSTQRWTLDRGRESVELAVVPRLVVNHFMAAHQAAVAGVGPAFLPSFYAERAVALGALVRLLDGWSRTTNAIHAVMPGHRYPRAAVRRFVDMLVERFGSLRDE